MVLRFCWFSTSSKCQISKESETGIWHKIGNEFSLLRRAETNSRHEQIRSSAGVFCVQLLMFVRYVF
ncbi:hypothetical protein Hamer_G015366 [Homarus americanus]|uniref:Uncharacterized protein n=1 Tax=Homarus americanus TaxID=6706 RepID=A0A8J5TQT1_HOMAM|nr:hypothetical protein Hamer_G015366 [Homarus americanus]